MLLYNSFEVAKFTKCFSILTTLISHNAPNAGTDSTCSSCKYAAMCQWMMINCALKKMINCKLRLGHNWYCRYFDIWQEQWKEKGPCDGCYQNVGIEDRKLNIRTNARNRNSSPSENLLRNARKPSTSTLYQHWEFSSQQAPLSLYRCLCKFFE